MALKRLPAKPKALTAATAAYALDKSASWKTWKFGNQEWQAEGWRMYDIVGELRFLANWIGDSISQARMYVAEYGDDGEEIGEAEDPEIRGLASIPLGQGSARDDNLRLLGIDLAVAGEGWVIGPGAGTSAGLKPGQAGTEPWFVVTSGAISWSMGSSGNVTVCRPGAMGGELELIEGRDLLLRSWRPHPNALDQADSPTRAAIPPLREIELLTKREFAELESRLTGAGVWPLPEGLDFPRGPNDPPGMSGFMAYLQKAAAANMVDQSLASNMVPIMFSVPDSMLEHIDKLKPINFWSELSSQIMPMKINAIGRVAAAFEIPSEVLTGLTNSSHWGSWLVSEEAIKRIRPYLAQIADTFTRGFLVRRLEVMGKDPTRFGFAFDTSMLAARPNRIDDAMTLWDRGLISDADAVRAGAYTPEQIPDQAERLRMLLMRVIDKSPAVLSIPGVAELLGLPAAVGTPPIDIPQAQPAENTEPSNPQLPDTLDDGPPTTRPALTSSAAPFETAMKVVILRALELAGGRLTTPAERRNRYTGVPRHQLHARLGPIPTHRAEKVLEGAWLHVPDLAADLGLSATELRGALHSYCIELLTRGMAHHDDLLAAALRAKAV